MDVAVAFGTGDKPHNILVMGSGLPDCFEPPSIAAVKCRRFQSASGVHNHGRLYRATTLLELARALCAIKQAESGIRAVNSLSLPPKYAAP